MSAREASARTDSISWNDPRPKASARWWRQGRDNALGTIEVPASDLAEPWERILSASLGPGAAGRIEWVRLVVRESAVYPARSAQGTVSSDTSAPAGRGVFPRVQSVLIGPTAWTRALRPHYSSTYGVEAVLVLHVIGRAVSTSAGAVMDVTGEAAESSWEHGAEPRSLLQASGLLERQPIMVILQAEPTAEDGLDRGQDDDHGEKLRLAAALAAGGTSAVLLIPAVPAAIADQLAQIITGHVRAGRLPDVQVLLRRLRAAITPHVPARVLDDVVLFLNERWYRS